MTTTMWNPEDVPTIRALADRLAGRSAEAPGGEDTARIDWLEQTHWAVSGDVWHDTGHGYGAGFICHGLLYTDSPRPTIYPTCREAIDAAIERTAPLASLTEVKDG